MCNHTESIMGCHYTALINTSMGGWVRYNDTQTSSIDLSSRRRLIVHSIVKKKCNRDQNMENSTVKQDKLSEVLNKSNVMVLVIYLAICFIVYFLMDVFNKEQSSGEQKDVQMSKLLDTIGIFFCFNLLGV